MICVVILVIKLNNVCFKYKDGKEIFKDLNLEIYDGEIISIIGKNGVGKSTLAKIIAGLLKPNSGDVLLNDINIYDKKNFIQTRKKIGMVFQNPDNQILFNNVYDDLKFALDNLGIDEKDVKIQEALNKVDMKEFLNKDTFKLSLGQKQRINIASVIATNPNYFILDEACAMIDPQGKDKIYEIIKNLAKENKTIIYITNNINEILLSNKVFVVENKTVNHIFKTDELLNNIDLLKKLNIKIPDILNLALLLNESGMNIDIKDFTLEKLAQKILKELKK